MALNEIPPQLLDDCNEIIIYDYCDGPLTFSPVTSWVRFLTTSAKIGWFVSRNFSHHFL